jgi:predicted O-methyltransferase YrrM
MAELGWPGPTLNRDHFPPAVHRIVDAIERVRQRGGERYTAEGKIGYRNPVKRDTAPCLMSLTVAHRPGTILEIGTGYGLSALHFALANTGARVVTVELVPTVAEEAKQTFADAGLDYQVRVGVAADIIDEMDREVDMIFIDHQPSMYLPDFLHVEPKLAQNAVVLADNVIDRRDENSDFVEYVLDRYGGVILPTQSGLLYSKVDGDVRR